MADKNNTHDGHRKRIDEKFYLFGFEGLREHEQLEQLLFAVIPRGNTNEIAHRLLDKYGTLKGVITADAKELEKVDGVGHRTAIFLATLPELMGAVQRSVLGKSPRLKTQEELENYVKTLFFGKLVETAYLLFLNSSDRLISFERLSQGVTDETFIYPLRVTKKAIVADADKVVVAHNHPYGVSKPSNQDVIIVKQLLDSLNVVNIELRDSIIVAGGECYSMREHGYLIVPHKRY